MKNKQEPRQRLRAGIAIAALFFALTASLNVGVSEEALTETQDSDFLVLDPERE